MSISRDRKPEKSDEGMMSGESSTQQIRWEMRKRRRKEEVEKEEKE